MRFLFVDRIIQSTPGEWIGGIKHITRDDAYLTQDAQGQFCFIPSLIGETLGQLAAWNVMQHNQFTQRPVAGVVASARLHRPAYVGETLILESHIDALDERAVLYHSIARVGDEPVFSVEGALGPLLPMTDFIAQDTVQQQFHAIYHPGDWEQSLSEYTPCDQELLTTKPGAVVAPMQFDAILASTPGVSLVAEKRITGAAPYFGDHFPNKPVLPMTVLLECILNLTHEFTARAAYPISYRITELRKIKMNVFVQPGDSVLCHATVKQQSDEVLILSYRCEVANKRVCVVDVVLEGA